MGIKGIDHWVIVAGNLERTLDFYTRLGFTVAWEDRPGGGRGALVWPGLLRRLDRLDPSYRT